MEYTYTNTTEYRALFRNITQSSNPDRENPFEIDDETLDENDYDEQAVSAFLDHVYEQTKMSPLFHALYDAAAAKMISESREIGLTILLSYDYLWAFYPCFREYIQDPAIFSETNPWYTRLLASLY